jgi:hypothetical protein
MPGVLAYLVLLFAGVAFFLLHYFALLLLSQRMRSRHPTQWRIIAQDEQGLPVGALRRWVRLQNALRSPVIPALDDGALTRWRNIWRTCPWLAWLCLLAALAMRWIAR